MAKSLLIKNGLVVDGTGAAPRPADILIQGDRIVEIIDGRAACPQAAARDGRALCPQSAVPPRRVEGNAPYQTIDAAGCVVSPGFVDSHAHSDAYLVIEPGAPSKISQGITTEINGQCGGSAAPRFGEARLSSDWASVLGDRLTWRSFAEYRAALEAARPAVNSVQFVGHNTLRSSVVGYAGRPATPDELRRMVYLLEQSIDEGAYGLTTGLIYQPGKYSTPDEVTALAAAAARKGAFYATHMRSEGDHILEAIDEVIELVHATGIRAEISHLKTGGRRNWGKIDAVLERVESAVSAGLLLGSDRYPYCAAGTDLDVVLPDWAQEGAAKAECVRLADPSLRARIVAELDASPRDWSEVMIGGTWHPETKRFSGRRVSEILEDGRALCPQSAVPDGRAACPQAAARRVEGNAPYQSPGELVCSVLEKDLCRTGAFFFSMSEANLDKILSRPWIVPGSDASLRAPWGPLGEDHPHPRAYATMPEFLRRLRALGFTLEEAVARMTSVPARRFGLKGRGVIEKGAFADIAVWREDGFCGRATYKDPHQFSTGVECVVVNGEIAYAPGLASPARPGRLLAAR